VAKQLLQTLRRLLANLQRARATDLRMFTKEAKEREKEKERKRVRRRMSKVDV
jgi:hypothetical protein